MIRLWCHNSPWRLIADGFIIILNDDSTVSLVTSDFEYLQFSTILYTNNLFFEDSHPHVFNFPFDQYQSRSYDTLYLKDKKYFVYDWMTWSYPLRDIKQKNIQDLIDYKYEYTKGYLLKRPKVTTFVNRQMYPRVWLFVYKLLFLVVDSDCVGVIMMNMVLLIIDDRHEYKDVSRRYTCGTNLPRF